VEVELKFDLPPASREALLALPALAAGKPEHRRLRAIYFDTPDCALARAQMALRLRRSGRRWVQTLKSGASGAGGLHARDEWEFARPGPSLDLSLFAESPLADLDEAATLHQRLAPVFEVDTRRTAWQLAAQSGSRLEVAFDTGEVASGERREAFSEVEIECLEGGPDAAFDLAARMLDQVTMRPSAVTKAQRGYRLFRGARLAPVKSAPIELEAAMAPPAAARAIIASNLDQLQANEEGVLRSASPEFVHQARIALRRMRSALRLFRDAIGAERAAGWREQLAGAGAALGRARDWDVLGTESLPPALAAYGDAALGRRLRSAVSRRRRAEREHVRLALLAASHAKVILEIARWLGAAQPSPDSAARLDEFAARVMRKRHKRLLADAAHVERLTSAERHRLRIDAKRLRYGVESLASVFKGRRTKRYVLRLVGLQDTLGREHDAVTALALLPELEPPAPFAAFARGWFGAIARGDPRSLEELVARFERARRPWRSKAPRDPTAA
jgi:inorganic triphosphatase YgiF